MTQVCTDCQKVCSGRFKGDPRMTVTALRRCDSEPATLGGFPCLWTGINLAGLVVALRTEGQLRLYGKPLGEYVDCHWQSRGIVACWAQPDWEGSTGTRFGSDKTFGLRIASVFSTQGWLPFDVG